MINASVGFKKNTFSHLQVLAMDDLAQALGFLPKIKIFACD